MQIVTHYQQHAAYVQLLVNCDKMDRSQLFGKNWYKSTQLHYCPLIWYQCHSLSWHAENGKKFSLKKTNPLFFLLFLGMREYCSTDTFDVTCGENEAIMMQSAIYGRMQAGRCISGEDIIFCPAKVFQAAYDLWAHDRLMKMEMIYHLPFPLEGGLPNLLSAAK